MLGCRDVAPPTRPSAETRASSPHPASREAAPMSYYGRSLYSVSWSAQVTKAWAHAQRGGSQGSWGEAWDPLPLPLVSSSPTHDASRWRPWQHSRWVTDAADADATRSVTEATGHAVPLRWCSSCRDDGFFCVCWQGQFVSSYHRSRVSISTRSKPGWCQIIHTMQFPPVLWSARDSESVEVSWLCILQVCVKGLCNKFSII